MSILLFGEFAQIIAENLQRSQHRYVLFNTIILTVVWTEFCSHNFSVQLTRKMYFVKGCLCNQWKRFEKDKSNLYFPCGFRGRCCMPAKFAVEASCQLTALLSLGLRCLGVMRWCLRYCSLQHAFKLSEGRVASWLQHQLHSSVYDSTPPTEAEAVTDNNITNSHLPDLQYCTNLMER